MFNRIGGIVAFTLFAGANLILSLAIAAQQIPQQLQPPLNEQLFLKVHATGDQIYTCGGDATKFAWMLKAPDARPIRS